MSILLLGID